MKMLKEHYEELAKVVKAQDTPENRKEYKRRQLSNMRYRWDCLWRAKQERFMTETLYQYLNDDHIDTALRKIVPDLNEVYMGEAK